MVFTVDQDLRFLLIGLGNPGRKHSSNRHNVGFMVIDRVALRHNISLKKIQFKAVTGSGRIRDRSILLAKPMTYMNLSGSSIMALSQYYQIPSTNMLVIYDEIDLQYGVLRIREKGGSGGHNGMRSVIDLLGPDFPRIRVGVGRPPGQMDPANYVLRNFSRKDKKELDNIIDRAADAALSYVQNGIEVAMNKFNGVATEI